VVESIKGPSGGYKLIDLDNLDVYTVFSALDSELTEFQDEQSLDDRKLNHLLNNEVYRPIEHTVSDRLKSLKIKDLIAINQSEMYYI
jgi:DNA-binding IscR family transcriptional regulator